MMSELNSHTFSISPCSQTIQTDNYFTTRRNHWVYSPFLSSLRCEFVKKYIFPLLNWVKSISINQLQINYKLINTVVFYLLSFQLLWYAYSYTWLLLFVSIHYDGTQLMLHYTAEWVHNKVFRVSIWWFKTENTCQCWVL